MEPEFAPVVTPREILYHLPELISGREPVLANPVARRLMLANPECREALLAVTRISTVFSGQGRTPTHSRVNSDSCFKRTVGQVQRVNRTDVANLLFEVGVNLLEESASAQGWHLERPSGRRIGHNEARHRLGRRRSLPNSQDQAIKAVLRRKDSSSADFFRTALQFAPGSATLRFALETAAYYENRGASISALREIASSSVLTEVQSAALGLIGRTYLDNLDVRRSLAHYRAAHDACQTYALHALYGALTSILTRDRHATSEFVNSLERLASPDNAILIQGQVFGDSDLWWTASQSDPIAVRDILRCIGSLDINVADSPEAEH